MLARCRYPGRDKENKYVNRGITVCEAWLKFENFLADMGERPIGMTIDRFPDNNGDYKQSNCRWATKAEQVRNARSNVNITWDGKTMCRDDWAREWGLDPQTLRYRLNHGWSIKEAFLTKPIYSERRTTLSVESELPKDTVGTVIKPVQRMHVIS